MITFQAIWTHGKLHVWGERADGAGALAVPAMTEGQAETEFRQSDDRHASSAIDYSAAAPLGALRSRLGDTFDSLLVSGAVDDQLTLRLPFAGDRPVPSAPAAANAPCAPNARSVTGQPDEKMTLKPCRVPTLSFSADDAVDLLTAAPVYAHNGGVPGTSLLYWSRMAEFVLELLAAQRFVPAVHAADSDRIRGYWRAVLEEDRADRLAALVRSMPPVCRSMATDGEDTPASTLVDNFLWTTVDTLVRRCLEGDELAHAILDCDETILSAEMLWLRSLVQSRSWLEGTLEQRRAIFDTVGAWLSRLEPLAGERTCRTCLRLHPPSRARDGGSRDADRPWTLTLHVQASHDPAEVVDVEQLLQQQGNEPTVFKRPFDRAWEQVQADLTEAVRYFPPLRSCLKPSGAPHCSLTLEEAYSFLRDAAPILESEGFGVWLPNWWHTDSPRLRMWLDVKPEESSSATSGSSIGLDALVRHDWRVALGDENLAPEEIARLAESMEPLVQVRGRWTEVQPNELRTAVRYLTEHRGGTMTVFEALRQCYVADDLETGLPVAGLRASGWIKSLLHSSEQDQAIERLDPPAAFLGALRPYQLRGMEWLVFLSRLGLGACLADDMGLGKTIQMIAVWLHEREASANVGPTLLVVPMSLVGNWQREIQRFAPSLRVMVHHGLERLTGQEFIEQVRECDVVISTYGLIHRDFEHVVAVEWYRVALDEAQNIKNPAAKQSQAIRTLRAVHRVALTGTPVENRLSELWSIMDFLNGSYLGSATEFRRRFAVPIERHHDSDRAQRLRHLIRPFVLRRLKSDPSIQVDLPEKMEMKVFCNLTREQAALYQAIVDDMLGQIDRAGGIQRRGLILATLVKLKQICNHPAHYLSDGSALPHRSGKCERLTEMLEEALAEGDRALIFTQFREMGELVKTLLHNLFDREILFLHGGTTRKNRDAIVSRFQDPAGNADLLILSLKAGGYGLNLTAASHVFHFDRWWNPAVEDQATDRAHRIGQDKRVQVHKFVCVGTLEERIDALLEEKRNLADNIVGSGEEWLTEMSTDKLRAMFTLSRDAVAED